MIHWSRQTCYYALQAKKKIQVFEMVKFTKQLILFGMFETNWKENAVIADG